MTSIIISSSPAIISSFSSYLSRSAMEDPNMLAADCVVICCCCQCLILQILIFVLLKLPYKLIRKTRDYAKKRLRKRKKDDKITEREMDQYEDDHSFVGMHGESFRIEVDGLFRDIGDHGCGSCMEEVEKVLEEMSQKGEFAFGSFWGRKGSSGSLSTCVAKHEFDGRIVPNQIIEMIESYSYHSRSNIILPFRLTV